MNYRPNPPIKPAPCAGCGSVTDFTLWNFGTLCMTCFNNKVDYVFREKAYSKLMEENEKLESEIQVLKESNELLVTKLNARKIIFASLAIVYVLLICRMFL